MKSWISIIIAVIFLCSVIFFNIKQPKPLPAPPILVTVTPTKIPTPTLSSSACLPSMMEATITFQGAAGSLYGSAKLTNTSSHLCTLVLNQQLQLTYLPTIKNVKVIYTGNPKGITYSLEPHGSLYAQIRMQNGPQCSSPLHQVQSSLTYQVVPSQVVTFMNSGKPDFLINACQKENEITQIDIATFSATPLP